MKISCSKGSAKQLEDVVRNALGGVNSSNNSTYGMEAVEAASGFHSEDLDEIHDKLMSALGSKAQLSPAYGIGLGDGGFAWLYFNDTSGEIELLDANGAPLADDAESAIEYILGTWGTGVVNSATNTSNISGNPIMAGDENDIPSWLLDYYDVITDQEVANMWGMTVEDVEAEKADNIEAYHAHHIAWMEAKGDYAGLLDSYTTIEVVAEGGDVFPGGVSGGRLFDATDEIQRYLGIGGEYDDYDETYLD